MTPDISSEPVPSAAGPGQLLHTRIAALGAFLVSDPYLYSFFFILLLLTLIPLFGVFYPPLVDLSEHLVTSKLLWETITGSSQLDLRVSTFVGYKLFPYITLLEIGFFRLFGISLLNLPISMTVTIVVLYVASVVGLTYRQITDTSWRSQLLGLSFVLPAAACIFSACWFAGFVNYVLGVIFVVPAIYFSHEFVELGRRRDGAAAFIFLVLVYLSHPFAPVFWGLWCVGRVLASVVTWRVLAEWKRLSILASLFIPIALYHLVATYGTALRPNSDGLFSRSPFLTVDAWLSERIWLLLNGMFLRPDDAADTSKFAIFLIVFYLVAIVVAMLNRGDRSLTRLVVAGAFLAFAASWISEKFIPVPGGAWLAYSYRFATTCYAICTVTAAIVLIRSMPLLREKASAPAFYALAALSVVASLGYLFNIRASYIRFDGAARLFMAKVLEGHEPSGISTPHTQWHPDGTFIKNYTCMLQPDCIPPNLPFGSGLFGDLYPVVFTYRPPMQKLELTAVPTPTPETRAELPPEELSQARGIAADKNGNYFVADTGNARIVKFAPNGKVLLTIGHRGSGPGDLNEPTGIALDSAGKIYVSDSVANKLVRFDPTGKLEKEWSGPDDGFKGPRDIAVGTADKIYVIDQGRGRVVVFDPKTDASSVWLTAEQMPGGFPDVTGIGYGNGSVVLLDRGNDMVSIIDESSRSVRQWEMISWGHYHWHAPDAVIDAATNKLYVSSALSSGILIFDQQGSQIGELMPQPPAELNNPSSLALSRTAKGAALYVLNTSDLFGGGHSTVTAIPLPD